MNQYFFNVQKTFQFVTQCQLAITSDLSSYDRDLVLFILSLLIIDDYTTCGYMSRDTWLDAIPSSNIQSRKRPTTTSVICRKT